MRKLGALCKEREEEGRSGTLGGERVVGGDRRVPSYGGEYRSAREDKEITFRRSSQAADPQGAVWQVQCGGLKDRKGGDLFLLFIYLFTISPTRCTVHTASGPTIDLP